MPNYLSTDNRISSSSSSSSIDDALNAKYPFSSLPTINQSSTIEFNPEQQALQDNLNFLASMTNNESNFISNPIQEYIDHLNEICYQGFDNLNSLIQEQKWVCSFDKKQRTIYRIFFCRLKIFSIYLQHRKNPRMQIIVHHPKYLLFANILFTNAKNINLL